MDSHQTCVCHPAVHVKQIYDSYNGRVPVCAHLVAHGPHGTAPAVHIKAGPPASNARAAKGVNVRTGEGACGAPIKQPIQA